MTAFLIQSKVLDLSTIYDMLSPDDDVMKVEAEKEFAEAKEFVRKMNVVSTNKSDKGPEAMEVDNDDVRINN